MPVTAVVVGPGCVRSVREDTIDGSCWAAEALASIDDEFALVDARPVAVTALWRELFATLLVRPPAVLVCPSWWSDRRIETVVESARATTPDVRVVCRAAMLATAPAQRSPVVVEIAESLVAISVPPHRQPACTLSRDDAPAAVADEVARQVASMGGGVAVVDRPDGVGGAAELAALLGDRLRGGGVEVDVVDDDRLLRIAEAQTDACDETCPTSGKFDVVASRPRFTRAVTVAGGLAATGILAAGVVAASGTSPSVPETTLLIEGRVVVEVPITWTPRRIAAGPGSVRLQVNSPTDPHAAVHVTQSAVPSGETLQHTAETLRRAMGGEPPGVFADFNGDDRRGERPAVTYREIRVGHDIRWVVLLDGGLRISVGCQSAPGAEDAVRSVCERAIASVRRLG